MSFSAILMMESGNRVEMWRGAVLSAVSVSGLIPVLRWLKYASRQTRVRIPIDMKMNSDKCSTDLAAVCVMLELKSIR